MVKQNLTKSDAAWKRLQARAASRAFLNRADAARGNVK